jgi:hypothetical protein
MQGVFPDQIPQGETKEGDDMSHTPGPWTLGRFGSIQSSVGRPAFKGTAYPQIALATLDDRGEEERDANARLIAAAPQLLAACKAALGAFERNDCIDWNDLTRAIAKAEGTK